MEVTVIVSLGINHPSHDQNKVGVAKEEHFSDLQTVLEKDASLLSDHEVWVCIFSTACVPGSVHFIASHCDSSDITRKQ